jgi:hypothetical protein
MQVTMKTVMPSGSGSFNASYLSLPLGLTFVKSPCDASSTSPIPCFVAVVLQNLGSENTDNGLFDGVGNESLITHEAECEYGLAQDHIFECPSFGSSSTPMIISCNGSISGPITQTCSSYKHIAACASIGGGGSGSSGSGSGSGPCELIATSKYNITCNCTLYPPLYFGDYESKDLSVSFVALQKAVVSDFAPTFRSAGDLSASEVAGSWEVLVTVLVLGGSFTFLFFFAARADKDDYKTSLKNNAFGIINNKNTAANRVDRSKGKGGSRPPPVHSAMSLQSMEVKRDFAKIEASLPAVLRSEAVWTTFVSEMKVRIEMHECTSVFYDIHTIIYEIV